MVNHVVKKLCFFFHGMFLPSKPSSGLGVPPWRHPNCEARGRSVASAASCAWSPRAPRRPGGRRDPWRNQGKAMVKPWRNHGQTMGKGWEKGRKVWWFHGISMVVEWFHLHFLRSSGGIEFIEFERYGWNHMKSCSRRQSLHILCISQSVPWPRWTQHVSWPAGLRNCLASLWELGSSAASGDLDLQGAVALVQMI